MEEARLDVEARAVGGVPALVVVPRRGAERLATAQPVAIGYNHDIPHRGRVYHVQTEDSGRGRCTIITHVFHAGVIVATKKTEYAESTPVSGIVELLRESHKSMMRRLVNGLLDEAIGRCFGGLVGERPAARVTAEPPRLALVPAPEPRPAESEAQAEPEPALDSQAERVRALIDAMDMDDIRATLEGLRSHVAGVLGVALVDHESGMCLGSSGTELDMDVAASGIRDVMSANLRLMRALGIEGGLEDVLVTMGTQLHITRPVGSTLALFMAMDREQGNLALARHKLAIAASELAL